ncbi:hypothetical protein KXQ82_04960 [Mucilaginibacter sp. HMF5004]|nr:hypothetical protein [Mucilaginibacter rivuli]MBW4889050.1 hypothetical protein [Mucilaginibacter rivuli]
MIEPFDIELGAVTYSVFPEEDDMYTIFKDGVEYLKIQKDTEQQWIKLDSETELPTFETDAEINLIGKEIIIYQAENQG